MVQKNKPISSLLLISLIILLIGITGVFIYQNYELKRQLGNQQLVPLSTSTKVMEVIPSSKPSSLPIDNLTLGWKTYTNTKHNYLIKFPAEFMFLEGPVTAPNPEFFQNLDAISVDGKEFSFHIIVNPNDAHGDPIVCLTDEECKLKVLTTLQMSLSEEIAPFSAVVFGKTRIGFAYESSNPLYTTYFHYLIFLENHNLWEIVVYKQDSPPNYDFVNKVLSTFEFID